MLCGGDSELRMIEGLTRVETFGDEGVHWVRATVDTRDPEVFSFQPEVERAPIGSTPNV